MRITLPKSGPGISGFHRKCGVFFLLLLAVVNSTCQDDKKKEEEKKEPTSPFLFDAAFSVSTESTPDNFTAREGKWKVDGSKKAIGIAGEPIVDGRVEFGPEIRETGATALTTSFASKSDSPSSPWFGVGLYGKNGFSLRMSTGAKKLELIRRGEPLAAVPFPSEPGTSYRMEISVREDGPNWTVVGRAWEAGKERSAKAQLTHKAYGDELLFPLAGRPFLLAVPFSGEPVYFTEAKVLKGEFAPWMDDWRKGNPSEKKESDPKDSDAE